MISAKRTGLEEKWTREFSPSKSISAKRKKAAIDGHRKKYQQRLSLHICHQDEGLVHEGK